MSQLTETLLYTNRDYCCSVCGSEGIKKGGYWMGHGAEIVLCDEEDCHESMLHAIIDALFDTHWTDDSRKEIDRQAREWCKFTDAVFWKKQQQRLAVKNR